MKTLILIVLLITFAFIFFSCQTKNSPKPIILTSINPITEIVREITGTHAEVERLLPPGASPHTFSLKPSDIVKAQNARILFYVSDNLDSWASQLPLKNKAALLESLPKEFKITFGEMSKTDDSTIDPHFWTDPHAIKAIVPYIEKKLSELDPENAQIYRNNAESFVKKLENLDKQIIEMRDKIRSRPIFLFHPSFLYLIKRYGLNYGGSVEPSPGKEPSAKFISDLIEKIKMSGAKAIFTEPQLPERPAVALSEAAKVNLYTLDPIGGTDGKKTYTELILYNVKTLVMALE